jgi:hypothetical protein
MPEKEREILYELIGAYEALVDIFLIRCAEGPSVFRTGKPLFIKKRKLQEDIKLLRKKLKEVQTND